MQQQNINPEKITKPIQILAAWLAGLLSIDSCFLIAAANIDSEWQSSALVVASIANVPLFLLAVFLLQTKFRPELQEDSYYASYLSHKTNKVVSVKKEESNLDHLIHKIDALEISIKSTPTDKAPSNNDLGNVLFGINKHLSNREKLKESLSRHGIVSCTSFGGEEPPSGFNMSISQYLNKDSIDAILAIAQELEFETYNFFDNIAEETEEDVLLGSYGVANYELLRKIA